eukprot:Opistho-2@74088
MADEYPGLQELLQLGVDELIALFPDVPTVPSTSSFNTGSHSAGQSPHPVPSSHSGRTTTPASHVGRSSAGGHGGGNRMTMSSEELRTFSVSQFNKPNMKRVKSMSGETALGVGDALSEADYFDMLCRACRGVLHDQDRAKLYEYIVTLPPSELQSKQEQCHEYLTDGNNVSVPAGLMKSLMSSKTKLVVAEASKHNLDFGIPNHKRCPVDEDVRDKIVLSSKKGKHTIKYNFHLPQKDSRYSLTIRPMSVIIKKDSTFMKSSKPLVDEIEFVLNCKTTLKLSTVIRMDVEDGPDHFFVINIQSDECAFGVDVGDLVLVDDRGFKVPSILKSLRECFVQCGGLKEPGVFRNPGDETEVKALKRALNSGSFTGSRDANSLATVIKVWFRDLPRQVLCDLPNSALSSESDTQDKAVAAYNRIGETNRGILTWLLDLLAEVAQHESSNQMNAHKLSIAITPNLFAMPTDIPPQESLRLSQGVVTFFMHLIQHQKALRS